MPKPPPAPVWPAPLLRALKPYADLDADALLRHLARASHVKQPGASWHAKVVALGGSPEVLGAILSLYTPDGKRRPNDDRPEEGHAAWGAAWATLIDPTDANLKVLEAACPWCRRSLGMSHQFAFVCAAVLARWPDEAALRILERFVLDPAMLSLSQTLRAGIRRQEARLHGTG